MSLDFSGIWINEAGHRLEITSVHENKYRVRYEPTEKVDRLRLRFDMLMFLRFSGQYSGGAVGEGLLVHVCDPWGPDMFFSPVFDDSNRISALAPSIAPGPFFEYEEIRGMKWFDTMSAFTHCEEMPIALIRK